jgi:hypothetical protein
LQERYFKVKSKVAFYQVTQAEDSLSISDNNSSDVIFRPISQNVVNVALVMDCDE